MKIKVVKECSQELCKRILGIYEVEAHSDEFHKIMSSICFCDDHGIPIELDKMFGGKVPYLYDRTQVEQKELKKIEEQDPSFGSKYHKKYEKKQASFLKPKKYKTNLPESQSSIDIYIEKNKMEEMI